MLLEVGVLGVKLLIYFLTSLLDTMFTVLRKAVMKCRPGRIGCE